MSRWFRLDDDVVNDPKVQSLPDGLFRAWVNVLCIASKNDGELPEIQHTAFMLRMTDAKAAETLSRLHRAGLIDKTERSFKPHNWDCRQFKSDHDVTAAERSKRYRDGKRDHHASVTRDGNASVTRDVTRDVTDASRLPETDTETETEKKDTREVALADGWPSDFRIQFWNAWPNKVGKPKAMNELERLRKRGVGWETIFDGMHRYIRTKPPDRPWLNPATFLHQERFNDQPAEVSSGKSESLSSIAMRQADAGISFGPRPTGLRIVESGDDVRMLPEAGRERSGDLRGSDNCDPVGVSGFGD